MTGAVVARHRWSVEADRALLAARNAGASWADAARAVELLRGVPTSKHAAQQRAAYLARTRKAARYQVVVRRRGDAWRVAITVGDTTEWIATTRSPEELRAFLRG